MDGFFATDYWYLKIYGLMVLAVALVLAWLVGQVWWKRRQQWRNVKPHYGSVYDASERTYRPNVDLRRVR